MKNSIRLTAFLVLCLVFIFALPIKKVIVIDVGHGGNDHGSLVEGISEKQVCLEIANKLLALNKNSKIQIILTRSDNKFLTLKERTEFINELNPDYMISLHANMSADITMYGSDLFVSKNEHLTTKSLQLANFLKKSLGSEREVKQNNFYLLKNVNCPSVLLELGYLSNTKDRNYMMSNKGQEQIAKAILSSIK